VVRPRRRIRGTETMKRSSAASSWLSCSCARRAGSAATTRGHAAPRLAVRRSRTKLPPSIVQRSTSPRSNSTASRCGPTVSRRRPRRATRPRPRLRRRGARPNEDSAEQTRPRRANGSSASYSSSTCATGTTSSTGSPRIPMPMPDVIKHGPPPAPARPDGDAVRATCPTGRAPENAPVAGLPVAYFMRQLQDFEAACADRRSAEAEYPP
jgi:hypothetical protein